MKPEFHTNNKWDMLILKKLLAVYLKFKLMSVTFIFAHLEILDRGDVHGPQERERAELWTVGSREEV